ncbi:MAG: bifunctional enoyl-CoA hydratase/phosphate acetyltransferase [Hyphomicrobiaceae bacterium]|nr:bifunctional enoyl-CoA hydratase/phosphate acetyltransferase [Hyphomicrobiaceae bacterium]
MSTEAAVQIPTSLVDAAAALPPLRTAIVNAGTPLVMESVWLAAEARIIEPVLFGKRNDIKKSARALDWDIAALEIVDADDETAAATQAALAAGSGDVAALMKGHVHTNTLMRAVLNKKAGLRTGRRLAHVFAMYLPDRPQPILISDAALNVEPDEETHQAIILNCIDVARALGVSRPKIALLSATEEASEAVPSSMRAARLSEWAQGEIETADVFGPLALDLAVSTQSAQIKGISNPVAGHADAIVVPEIVAGNALFKALVNFAGACAAGLVTGARVPVLLTSRADPPAARLASAALTSVYRHHMEASAGEKASPQTGSSAAAEQQAES